MIVHALCRMAAVISSLIHAFMVATLLRNTHVMMILYTGLH